MQIKWTRAAREDLNSVADFLPENTTKKAKEVVFYMMQLVKLTASSPEMGRSGEVFSTRDLVLDNYPFVISYRVWEDEFQVLRVLHRSKKQKEIKGLRFA